MSLSKLFAGALAIRWAYALLIFAFMGDGGLQGTDSIGYLTAAHSLAEAVASGSLHGLDWLGTNAIVMPLFAWLLGLHALVFGTMAPLSYVLMQGIIDAGTCLLVHGMAGSLDRRFAWPAGLAAALNPTQIVLSGLVYTDTPFIFFVALFLYGSLQWLRAPGWRAAALIGIGLGAATLVRTLAAPWAPLLLVFLPIAARRLSRTVVAQLIAAGAIVALCLAPVLWRNVSQYGAWSITAQGGIHLARWVVPLVREARDGTPWAKTHDEMERRTAERFPQPTSNPFEQSRRYTVIAREQLAELGAGAVTKAWLTGVVINLASPAIILSPPVSQLPRTGFYGTPGTSPVEKAMNFLFHSDNARYAWILLIGIAGVAAARAIQLAGFAALAAHREHWPALGLLGLWIAFVLAINGPIASPKYRLPLEPPLMVLTGAGLSLLFRRRLT